MSIGSLQRAVNLSRGQLDQALKLLELDGAVEKVRGLYARTAAPWQPDEERIARVIATRKLELEQMRTYVTYPGCRMEYLTRLLDDPAAGPCGRCANDVGKGMPHDVDPVLVQAAIDFLRRSLRVIEPRKRWVEGGGPEGASVIAEPNEDGVALSVLGDAGWGRDVGRARVGHAGYSSALVGAAVSAIRDSWRPDPAPDWVTAIPSRGVPGALDGRDRVTELGRAIASGLGLPFVACLTTTPGAESQASMQNSVLQLANARAGVAFSASAGAIPSGPVLLVDDLVDSRWTLTVAGALLRANHSGPVLPFALAGANQREG